MEQTHYKTNINRLPIGTKFYCVNGAWHGVIVKEVGMKYVKAYDSYGTLQNVTSVTKEKGQRCKIDIRIDYLPKQVRPLPYKENVLYDVLDVLELPIGTVLQAEDTEWQGEVEIIKHNGDKVAWFKKYGKENENKTGCITQFPMYVMRNVTIQKLGEDLLRLEQVGERKEEVERGMCY
ncbi:hypothetical protein [Bacillus thuringiensis]|uniref:hypothetical protein n=1 Tax=Bacillus thuringiensis TaxID=1428 RepID=UPI000BFE6B18|nr:hypothetical protein [Bacillus thuringiensis]PGT90117.1 hypothetical protein COD17_10225 [Bacillus thuringiensis]